MRCPKCSHEQESVIECEVCGLLFRKFDQAREQKQEQVEVAPFVRTVFSLFKVKSLPVVRLPVSPSAASRHRLRPVFFSLIVNGAGPCCTSPDIA